jgi:hypothetical protein
LLFVTDMVAAWHARQLASPLEEVGCANCS